MTLPALLTSLVASDPGRPLVTFYDERTGERVELSVTTWSNWVAKVASLLVDECDRERGDVLRLDLPPHWLATVFAAAAWTAGLQVLPTDAEPASEADVVVCGPDSLPRWAPAADDVAVLACALLPLGVRFAEPVPPGVLDVGVEVWSQPDAFVSADPPSGEDTAVPGTDHATLLRAAGDDDRVADGDRLLTTADLGSTDGLRLLVATWLRGASLVLVTGGASDERLQHLAEVERTTRRVGTNAR